MVVLSGLSNSQSGLILASPFIEPFDVETHKEIDIDEGYFCYSPYADVRPELWFNPALLEPENTVAFVKLCVLAHSHYAAIVQTPILRRFPNQTILVISRDFELLIEKIIQEA